MTPNSELLGFCDFRWDGEASSKDVRLSNDQRHAYLFESQYCFRTMLADKPFNIPAVYYWEFVSDNRTENELKIGVTLSKEFNINTAFADYEFGYSYYGLG